MENVELISTEMKDMELGPVQVFAIREDQVLRELRFFSQGRLYVVRPKGEGLQVLEPKYQRPDPMKASLPPYDY